MNQDQARDYLATQMELLDQIRANTERQSRFIKSREIRGLGRMLRERSVLIERLVMINKLLQEVDWEAADSNLKNIRQTAVDQQDEIYRYINRVMNEAMVERDKIKMELNSIRVKKNLKNQYEIKWKVLSFGNRFNAKG